jgi:hypothetical protein
VSPWCCLLLLLLLLWPVLLCLLHCSSPSCWCHSSPSWCVTQATEDWLYDEGEDCTKSVYVAKLEELQTLGGPVFSRQQEDQVRGGGRARRGVWRQWWPLWTWWLCVEQNRDPGQVHATYSQMSCMTLALCVQCGISMHRSRYVFDLNV